MRVSETQFESELDAFRRSAESASQFFYAYQTIHYLASKDGSILSFVNQRPFFWNTNLNALQAAMFTALGTVFDTRCDTHRIDSLLKAAQDSPELFELRALRARKSREANRSNEWLDEFMARAYEPTSQDWRRLRKHVTRWRGVYQANYKSIRHTVYAHQGRISPDEKAQLFEGTSYVELEKLFAFLDAFHHAIAELYANGSKPVIRYRRRSVVEMIETGRSGRLGATTAELVVRDVSKFFAQNSK